MEVRKGQVFYDLFIDNLVIATGNPGPFHDTFDVIYSEDMDLGYVAFYIAAIGIRLIHIGDL